MLCMLCLYVMQILRTRHIGKHQKASEGQLEALLMSEKGRKKNPQREGPCREALSPRNTCKESETESSQEGIA